MRVGENMAALKHPATAAYTTAVQVFADTNGDFVDVDSTSLNLTITTTGGDVLVHFEGSVNRSSNAPDLDVEVDGPVWVVTMVF